MGNHITIDFRLQAEVNGESFQMNGEGIGDPKEGTCVLRFEADPKFPKGFDPVSCPCICSHPTSLYFARELIAGTGFPSLTDHSYTVQPARQGIIHGPNGTELLNLRVAGSVKLEGNRLMSIHTMRGTSNLPPLARNLTPVDDYIVPGQPGQATALLRFRLLTQIGLELDGITFVPYKWNSNNRLEAPLLRRIEDLKVEWDGGRYVTAFYRSSIRSLVVSNEDVLQPSAIPMSL